MASHEYRVVICDTHGVLGGEIATAVITSVTWELNGIGEATFTFPVLDEIAAALLPITSFPAVVEIQIWRDGQIIWWGVPVSAAADRTIVTVQCSGLLWYLQNMAFGPNAAWQQPTFFSEYLANRQFEDDLNHWSAVGCTASVDSIGSSAPNNWVLLDQKSARLGGTVGTDPNTDSYLVQSFSLNPAGGAALLTLSGWYNLFSFTGPAAQNRGLFLQLFDSTSASQGVAFAQLAANAVTNAWTQLSTSIAVPAHADTWTIQARLYSPGGIVLWDDISCTVPQSVGTDPGGSDLAVLVDRVMDYANDPTAGKWAMNIPYDTSVSSVSVIREQTYQFYDNTVVLDALSVLPTTGVCDYEVTWPFDPASSSPARQLHLYAPQKGTINLEAPIVLGASNFTDVTINVDGSTVKTAVRVLGQGSGGTARELGYVAFPSHLGGRVSDLGVATIVAGSPIVNTSVSFFGASDVDQPIYGLTGAMFADGAFPPGATVSVYISPTQVALSVQANYSDAATTLGIGGVIVDTTASSVLNQNAGDVHASALRSLLSSYKPLVIPTPKVSADIYFGQASTGDVVPVTIDYGWAQLDQALMRIVGMTLYPVTEELSLTLNPVVMSS